MNSELWQRAQKLADRPYDFSIEEDALTDGQPVYLLRDSELPGCKAQGATVDEAKVNLDEARVDYIYALLEAGLDVPLPAKSKPSTGAVSEREYWKFDLSPTITINVVAPQLETTEPSTGAAVDHMSWVGDASLTEDETQDVVDKVVSSISIG